MSPKTFDALMVMVAHRQDGTERGYKFRALKSEDDKIRTWFYRPLPPKAKEMLRVSDNMGLHAQPQARPRLASREASRVATSTTATSCANYVADYTAKLTTGDDPKLWLLDLTAKSKEASYDHIKLWITKDKQQPAKAEYYATSDEAPALGRV